MRVGSGYVPKITKYFRNNIAKYEGKVIKPDGSTVRTFSNQVGDVIGTLTTKITNDGLQRKITSVWQALRGAKKETEHTISLLKVRGFGSKSVGLVPSKVVSSERTFNSSGLVMSQSQTKFSLNTEKLEAFGTDGKGLVVYDWNPDIVKKHTKTQYIHFNEQGVATPYAAYTKSIIIDSTGKKRPSKIDLGAFLEKDGVPFPDEKFVFPKFYYLLAPKNVGDLKTVEEFEKTKRFKNLIEK